MSLSLTTPVYTQAEQDFFITEAVIGLNSINAGIFYVATGVKNDKYVFPKATSTTYLNARQDSATMNGLTVLADRTIELGAFESGETFNPNIFENHWHKDQLNNIILDRGLPSTFENYIATYYTAKVLSPVENMIHIGSVDYTATTTLDANYSIRYFDGIIKQAVDSTDPSLSVSYSAVTSANIISKLEEMKNKMSIAVLSQNDRYNKLKFIMGVLDFEKYEEALTSTSFKNNDTTQRGINRYKGYEIMVLAGVPENTMYFTHADTSVDSNLQLALTDIGNMSFSLEKMPFPSKLYGYVVSTKMGVGIARPSEFVIHTSYVEGDFTV
jgi:hypothetical protein